jgi:alpha-glucosidase (family GH31 glycosyl hydrolase)
MKALISKINDLGFRTTLWMFPFINFDSKSFLHVIEKQYAITEPNSTRVSLTKWWDGLLAAMIDFTNKDASDWFVKQLNIIRNETGIDSFKFDAGEFEFVPTYYSLKNAPTTPEQFSMDYAKTAYRVGDAIEIRVGTLTQDIPVFRRMIDKDSQWVKLVVSIFLFHLFR